MIGIFLDLETNGLDPFSHYITQVALDMRNLATGLSLATYYSPIQLTQEEWDAGDPASIAYTGITFESLNNTGKKASTVRKDLFTLFEEQGVERGIAFFICQNPSFDRNFLTKLIPPKEQNAASWPYHWLDLASMHLAKELLKHTKPESIRLSKDSIAQKYGIPAEKKPHQADRGVAHLIACYEALIGFPEAAAPGNSL